MFSIGEFARHGRVSVRMLRHYDAIGLLRPVCVDPGTGYRSYQARQLAELNRLIALKDLGFTLQQVQAVLAEQVSSAELVGELTGTSPGYEPEAITPVIGPLYRDLWQQITGAGICSAGPAIAYYEDAPTGGGAIVVHAAVQLANGAGHDHGFAVVDHGPADHGGARRAWSPPQ
jgi:DNA-binding transcriptional MerR regulator